MGLNRVRVDSVAKLQKQKTMAELQEENEALKNKVSSLETNLDNTQMALCDVYEQLIAVTSAADIRRRNHGRSLCKPHSPGAENHRAGSGADSEAG